MRIPSYKQLLTFLFTTDPGEPRHQPRGCAGGLRPGDDRGEVLADPQLLVA